MRAYPIDWPRMLAKLTTDGHKASAWSRVTVEYCSEAKEFGVEAWGRPEQTVRTVSARK